MCAVHLCIYAEDGGRVLFARPQLDIKHRNALNIPALKELLPDPIAHINKVLNKHKDNLDGNLSQQVSLFYVRA